MKKYILIIISAILIVIFTPLFSKFYELIIGRNITSWFWGLKNPEYIEGFFMSYVFFVSFFLIYFASKNKFKLVFILVGIILLLDIIIGSIEGFVINFFTALIGWLFALFMLLITKYFKENNPKPKI